MSTKVRARHKLISKEAALDAIEKGGTVTAACQLLGISRQQWYVLARGWDEEVQQALEARRQHMVDAAEYSLLSLIQERNVPATIFALKTLGRKRGFVERHELAGVEGQPLVVNFVPADE
jgi:transposase-like protein